MERIKTIDYLKNKLKCDKKAKSDEGVILTRHGKDDLVLLDYNKYERLVQMAMLARNQ